MNSVELDINTLISQAQDEVPSSETVKVPENEYEMYIKPGSTKIFEGENDNGKWRLYTATAVVSDPAAREATNLENPSARIRFFLDVNATGSLTMGANRNVQLGRLLKATGMDKAGWTYGGLEGVNFKGRVKHVAEKKDPNRVNAEVVAFTKL